METNKVNRLFPLQSWLTSVIVLGPLLENIVAFIDDQNYFKSSDQPAAMTIAIIVFGLLYSLPVFLVSVFSYRYLVRHYQSAITVKIIFILICMVGVFLTFLVLSSKPLIGFTYYSSSVIISSFFYRIYKRINVAKNSN